MEAAAVGAVVVDAASKDGGTLFGVPNALDNNKQRYISHLISNFEDENK